tara:strand:- start:404 stop:1450 length:1047 start_codon:yes stop_codon:yes gene_type:complete
MRALPDKILIVGPSWVGDMVMAQSLFRELIRRNGNAVIDVLAPPWSEAIVNRMPEVRRVIKMPVGHGNFQLINRYRLGRNLAKQNYQQAILLPNSWKSALVPAFAGIPKRTGWRGEFRYGLLNDLRVLEKEAMPLMVERFVALAGEQREPLPKVIPPPKLIVDIEIAQVCAQKLGIDISRKILTLCPGAEFGPAKQWPTEYYAQLAKIYLDKNWQLLLLGSTSDQSVTAQISAAIGDSANLFDLAGRTTLGEAVDLLSIATAVVSNDSGLMHIAAALDRPMVAIYGPTSPGFTPPLSLHAVTVQLEDIDCAPCFKRQCPLQHHRCMVGLEPQRIVVMVDSMVTGEARD